MRFRTLAFSLAAIAALIGVRAFIAAQDDPTAREVPAERSQAALRATSSQAGQAGRQEAQTRMIRALLEALDEIEGEPEDVKDQIRRSLLESDVELEKLLGDNSRRLIMKANRRLPAPVVGGSAPRASGAAKEAEKPAEKRSPAERTEPDQRRRPADPGDPQTRIVKALIEALEDVKGESADLKDDLKESLRESDVHLRKVLGDNSRRMIEQANRKPAIVVGGAAPVAKKDLDTNKAVPRKPVAPSSRAQTPPDNKPQTRIVKALIETLDEIDVSDVDSEEARDEIRRSLLESDMQLRKILGENSRRLIMQANKKPPIPVVGGRARRSANKTKGEAPKESTEGPPSENPAEKP
jgi:hypothetical protein